MAELKIGRAIGAALHQAISEILPARVEFYEGWLTLDSIREGTLSRAKVGAVISFLRQEPSGYNEVVSRAGHHTAVWSLDALPSFRARLLCQMPLSFRAWAGLQRGARLIRALHSDGRLRWTRRRGCVAVTIEGSLFCQVRVHSSAPLCRFYSALLERCLESFEVPCSIESTRCRGVGHEVCEFSIQHK